jgi:hypothetical protein
LDIGSRKHRRIYITSTTIKVAKLSSRPIPNPQREEVDVHPPEEVLVMEVDCHMAFPYYLKLNPMLTTMRKSKQ